MTATINFFSLLAIIIPAILEVTAVTLPTTTPLKANCSDSVKSAEINKTILDAHTCFRSLVHDKLGIKNENNGTCKSVEQFNTTAIRNYLKATSQCKINITHGHKLLVKNLHKLVKVVNVTLGEDRYKKFYEHGGVMCVNEKKIEIESCVRKATARNVTLVPQLYLSFRFAELQPKQGCDEVVEIKDCIGKEFMKSPKNCSEHSINFTNFLFDKVSEEFCKNINTTDPEPSSSSRIVGAPISIAIIVYFAILKFQ